MSLYLVRHGETDDNRRKIVQMPDASLSVRGKQQAEQLARRLTTSNIGQVLCSDHRRARETSDIVNQQLKVPVLFESLLRERHFGDLRGRAYADIGYDIMADNVFPANGESRQAFYQRIAQCWQVVSQCAHEFYQRRQQHTLVVTHGLVCRALVVNHLQLSADQVIPEKWLNTSVTLIRDPAGAQVDYLNCTRHLKELELINPNSAAV